MRFSVANSWDLSTRLRFRSHDFVVLVAFEIVDAAGGAAYAADVDAGAVDVAVVAAGHRQLLAASYIPPVVSQLLEAFHFASHLAFPSASYNSLVVAGLGYSGSDSRRSGVAAFEHCSGELDAQ